MDEERIFQQALAIASPEDRAAFLERECHGNVALRLGVEQLLRSHDDAGSFLERPPAALDGEQTARLTGDTDDASRAPGELTEAIELSENPDLDFLAPPIRPGSLGRIDQYDVLSVVGRGGMGVVLKAIDTKLNRVVAVKVLAPELAANAVARRRFIREAQAAAAVSHPHVVTIHAVGDEHVPPYLTMEMVSGLSLREKIDQVGTLGVAETLRIGSQIAAGLAAAHRQGLIHRDIKPANILLENGIERVKITDFGLARAVDDLSVTRTGEVAGTPQYMSPEQAQGERVDHRGDLFSLGSVLYTMCTGRPPFRGDNAIAVIRRVVDDVPRPVQEINPEVPSWLCEVIMKLLEKNPVDRYQSATEVSEILERYLADVQAARTPQGPNAPGRSRGPRTTRIEDRGDSPRTSSHDGRSRERGLRIAQGAGGLAALLLLAGILIKITSRDGTVTEIKVPDGSTVELRTNESGATLPEGAAITPTPASISSLRHSGDAAAGRTFYFDVTGSAEGYICGTDVYTDDSSLPKAAVHAGALRIGQRGIVRVTVEPGQGSYTGSTRNGVVSHGWGTYSGSFRVWPNGPRQATPLASTEVRTDNGRLMELRGDAGKAYLYRTVGRDNGVCYGTDVYSDDSDLGTAAVHAGLLRVGMEGVVKVTLLPGQVEFQGTTRNGVTSRAYGSWGGAFRIEAPLTAPEAAPPPAVAPPEPGPGVLRAVAPNYAYVYGLRAGRSIHMRVTGTRNGFVYGTGVYSSDSSVAAAAVHAGAVKVGETAVVSITMLPGQDSYQGSTANGVTSSDWSRWEGSFRIEKATGEFLDPLPTYRGQAGKSFLVQVTGNASGPCWGTDVYSDDSDLTAAAVHAGLVRDGETGVVKLTILDGQASYTGSTRNGVTSGAYREWPGSFKLEAPPAKSDTNDAQADGRDRNAPVPAVAPFDPGRAKSHQEF